MRKSLHPRKNLLLQDKRGGKGVSRQQKTSAYAIMSIVAGADAGCLSSAAR